jgi:hypothetical protein
MFAPGMRRAVPLLTRDVRSAAFDASGIAPSRLLRVLAFASPCPHLETASAVLDDGPALTNAIVVAPARPPSSSTRIVETPPSRAAHFEKPANKCVSPGRATLVAAVFRMGFVRRQSTAADPGIPRTDDRRAAHASQRARLASCCRGHIEIIDGNGLRKTSCECSRAVRTRSDRPLNATNSCRPQGTRPRALASRGDPDAAPTACVYFANSSCQ